MRHTTFSITALAFGALVGVGPCQAQVFRCPNGAGVSFQQAPCNGLEASGGRLVRTSDGNTVRAADPVAPPSVAAPAPAASASASTVRVYGRTPLPGADVSRNAKSP